MVLGRHITASHFLFSQFIDPLYKNILLGQSVSHTEISSLPNSHLNGSVTSDGPCIFVRGENGPVSFAKSVRITGFNVETTAVGIM